MTIETVLIQHLGEQARQENEVCYTDIKAWLKSGRADYKESARSKTFDVDEVLLAIDEALKEC